jgi:hypothetical protein
LVEPQNQDRRFVSDLTRKPLSQVFRFESQNRQLRFDDFDIKITVMVYWFVPQNQAGYGLLVVPQNR